MGIPMWVIVGVAICCGTGLAGSVAIVIAYFTGRRKRKTQTGFMTRLVDTRLTNDAVSTPVSDESQRSSNNLEEHGEVRSGTNVSR